MILISKNGPDMASVHKFWYFLLVTYSFSLKNSNFWTKFYIQDTCISGNALARVQRVHKPVDLWDQPDLYTRHGGNLIEVGFSLFCKIRRIF